MKIVALRSIRFTVPFVYLGLPYMSPATLLR